MSGRLKSEETGRATGGIRFCYIYLQCNCKHIVLYAEYNTKMKQDYSKLDYTMTKENLCKLVLPEFLYCTIMQNQQH